MDIVIRKRGKEWVVDDKHDHLFEPWVGKYQEDAEFVLHVDSYSPNQEPEVSTSTMP